MSEKLIKGCEIFEQYKDKVYGCVITHKLTSNELEAFECNGFSFNRGVRLDRLLTPYLERNGISLNAACEKVGYDPSTFRKILNGQKQLYKHHLYPFCLLFEMTPDEAVGLFQKCQSVEPLSEYVPADMILLYYLEEQDYSIDWFKEDCKDVAHELYPYCKHPRK